MIRLIRIFSYCNLQNKKASIKEASQFVVEVAGFEPAPPVSKAG
tara:strand:+ start:501 stop:632 length:132 start_codon:yes stop_codon:yes gene_type:complete